MDYKQAGGITAESSEQLLNAANIDENSEAAKELTEAFEKLAKAQKKLIDATQQTGEADAKAKVKKKKADKDKEKADQKNEEAQQKLSERISGFFEDLYKDVNAILPELTGLLDNIGAGDLGKKINDIKGRVARRSGWWRSCYRFCVGRLPNGSNERPQCPWVIRRSTRS